MFPLQYGSNRATIFIIQLYGAFCERLKSGSANNRIRVAVLASEVVKPVFLVDQAPNQDVKWAKVS